MGISDNLASGVTGSLTSFQKVLKLLTWTKILQLTIVTIIFLVGLVAYELRENIHEISFLRIGHYGTPSVKLSKTSTDIIDSVVKSSELIVSARVITVDFQKNVRHVIYSYSDDKELEELYTKDANGLIFPLFSDDINNNKRLVDLINGEFVCDPYTKSIGGTTMPLTKPYIHTVCANGIPPYYGIFSGIISISLKREPTQEEVGQIRELSRSLAAAIYDKEFK